MIPARLQLFPILVLMSLMLTPSHVLAQSTPLVAEFRNPPTATKPRCYWYWFDDHVSKEGITRDLEAMREVGIGGAFIGIIGGAIGKRAESTQNRSPIRGGKISFTPCARAPASVWTSDSSTAPAGANPAGRG